MKSQLAALNAAVPPELDAVVSKALEKDPRLRYQTAADLLADLARLKRDSSEGRTVAAAAVQARPRTARRLLVLGAAAAVLVGSVLFGWWWQRRPERSTAPTPAHDRAARHDPSGPRIAACSRSRT